MGKIQGNGLRIDEQFTWTPTGTFAHDNSLCHEVLEIAANMPTSSLEVNAGCLRSMLQCTKALQVQAGPLSSPQFVPL